MISLTKNMRIIYTENNTKVVDSYKLTKKEVEAIVYEIELTRLGKHLPQIRSKKSYKCEIKAHNRLYKLGLFRSHTKDTDLEEKIAKWKEIFFYIVGW